MFMQTVNKSDTERVWINITNSDGQTITTHYPVFKFTMQNNSASVSTNEYGSRDGAIGQIVGNASGHFVGLAYEDIANGASAGIVQVYGYHESALVMRIAGSVTVIPGHPMGIEATTANSIGLSSAGAVADFYGPVVALDTVTATLHSLGTVGQNYTDHVLLRCL